MASPVLTSTSIVLCPHAGVAALVPSQSRVLASGAPVVTVADPAIVTGCANQQGPCATIAWSQGTGRVLVSGAAIVTAEAVGGAVTSNQTPVGLGLVAYADQRILA